MNANTVSTKGKPTLVINVAYTQYELMQDIAKECRFRLSYDEEGEDDWDIWWIDGPIFATLLQRMKWYQRTNRLPSVHVLARKELLAKNLNMMQQVLPDEYDFFPQTWVIPADRKRFKDSFRDGKLRTYIVKPDFQCQGNGIFLTRGCGWADNIAKEDEHVVAQRYITKPYLIEGLKFDLRLYVLVTGISPLRAYIYKEGLGRLATEPYEPPKPENLGKLTMHLTNYHINKEAGHFQNNEKLENAHLGHKRSVTAILDAIDRQHPDEKDKPSDRIWE